MRFSFKDLVATSPIVNMEFQSDKGFEPQSFLNIWIFVFNANDFRNFVSLYLCTKVGFSLLFLPCIKTRVCDYFMDACMWRFPYENVCWF
jgi:hypothetical protein